MKKFNIFEVYGQVHNEKIETPKVEVQAYSPISLGRKTPVIVDGKFSLTESLKKQEVVDEAKDPKEAIYQALVKGGNNPTQARKMVDKHYDYIQRVYGDASPKKKAEIIRTIHEGKLNEVRKLKPNATHGDGQKLMLKVMKDWGRGSDVHNAMSQWGIAWLDFDNPTKPLSPNAIKSMNSILGNYDLLEGKLTENLMGMKKEPIGNVGSSERYEYVIKGKKREDQITIDVLQDKEQGSPRSNMVSIRWRGGWLADTPTHFKNVSDVEKFIKKVHPDLKKIAATGEAPKNYVSFPD